MNRNRVAPPSQYEPGTGRAQRVGPEDGGSLAWAAHPPETACGHFSPSTAAQRLFTML